MSENKDLKPASPPKKEDREQEKKEADVKAKGKDAK